MFQQMKDLYNMQKKAKQVQKELKLIEIEAEEGGVIVVVNAAQEVISVNISDDVFKPENKEKIEKNIVIATTRAMEKAKKVAAEKMKPIMGDMGFGGM